MSNSRLTPERCRELLSYDPVTGVLIWRVDRLPNAKAGDAAGCDNSIGYWQLTIDGERQRAHRLIWLMVYDRWPARGIDHINSDGMDNRLENLREADQGQNCANQRRSRKNTSGYKGVTFSKHAKRWRASIQVRGRMKNLGYFDTPELAHQRYMEAARGAFGEFARSG